MSSTDLFGTLEDVALREAWTHEAHSFTPWLAQNLDRLADAIGIPLEHTGTEVAVESFSADIIARNLLDDTNVLIENQLEEADHRHLGQILTYLAGLDARTVVWVAPRFRSAHLSAIRWLNEHTSDPFSFFAVQLRVVRIANSPLAPLFDVLERPNEWERRLHEVARDSREISDLGAFRRAFWTHCLEHCPTEAEHGNANAASTRNRRLGELGLLVVQYLANDEVGVYIRGTVTSADAKAQLEPIAQQLESRLGVPFGAPGATHFFWKKLKIDSRAEANWPRMSAWLKSEADLYEAALRELAAPQILTD